jgi:hypothetical protein
LHTYERDVKPRQARIRDSSDTIGEKARHPDDAIGRRHGHVLAGDSDEENLFPSLHDGKALASFASRRI